MSANPNMEVSLNGVAQRLVAQGLLSEASARQAHAGAAKAGISFITQLLRDNALPCRDIASAAALEFGIPLFDLSCMEPDPDIVKLVSERLIQQHHALPLFRRGNRLFIAMSDPTNHQVLDEVKFHTGLTTEVVLVEDDRLRTAIDKALEAHDSPLEDLQADELDELDNISADSGAENREDTEMEVNDAPIVRFVNKILLDAIKRGASDIHFEPYENRYRIRFRLDGILSEVATPPANLSTRLAARIKVMAQLDISERRIPQDGRIKIKLSKNRAVDFRVSTCPTLFGEKVVLRVLDPLSARLDIDILGLDEAQKQLYLSTIQQPQGMVLVTGPTGSGKTVTLYTALKILNTADSNISTAEDPAEIYMPGINQVNINPKTGLTFANALRAFLRQDPDIIMVGEIRDLETAEIAIKAAQTGHLVLSTVHTNDAPQTLTRLLNMGVAPYNIASTVSLIIAQRLSRRLCDHCKTPLELPQEALEAAGFSKEQISKGIKLYGPKGCEHCNGGYKGRVGIFQMMPVSDAMGRIIMENGNAIQVADQARAEGVDDLRQAGLKKVIAGVTSLEEINRVIRE